MSLFNLLMKISVFVHICKKLAKPILQKKKKITTVKLGLGTPFSIFPVLLKV